MSPFPSFPRLLAVCFVVPLWVALTVCLVLLIG